MPLSSSAARSAMSPFLRAAMLSAAALADADLAPGALARSTRPRAPLRAGARPGNASRGGEGCSAPKPAARWELECDPARLRFDAQFGKDRHQ